MENRAVALVFYHGQTSPYPYFLHLADCFNDPLQLMTELFQRPIALIDINQLPDDQLKQQPWIGIVARALKHIRAADISPYLLDLLQDCEGLDDHSNQWLDFIALCYTTPSEPATSSTWNSWSNPANNCRSL
jgi:predicted transposase YdaD